MLRFSVVMLCCLVIISQVQAGSTKSAIGNKVENFTLSDFRGKEHSLKEAQGRKAVVVAFLGTECPLAKLYAPRLGQLAKSLEGKGVGFLAVMSNRQDSVTEIAAFARVHQIEFPVLKDLGNKVADQFGAARTPEIFLLDAQGMVRYHGRIDDQHSVGRSRDKAMRKDLEIAIEQLLAGKEIEVAETDPIGCIIGRVKQPKDDSEITYSNQIARIFQNRCVECHREGEIAPFAMTKYDEVAGWADMIAEVVRENRMPPWHADPKHGSFANARIMSEEEKETIYQWAKAGAPEGDPARLPEPRTYTTGWQLPREPDAVLYMSDKPFDVPAEGTVAYKYFEVDPGFKEDKWIEMGELIPENRAVVHHILVFVKPPGASARSRIGEGGAGFLAAYVPGFRPEPFPKGMAKRVQAGSTLIFQMHYTPNGSPQKDRSKLGLIFANPSEITHVVKTVEAIQPRFEIPPHADNYSVEADSSPYEYDLQLLSMSPHMHLRGKSFSYEARYPDGRKEMLLDVPHYDSTWQTTYLLSDRKPFPKVTTIHCVAHYDNSETNLANPNPDEAVRWGDQTWQEMMIGFYDVAMKIDPKDRESGNIPDIEPSIEWQADRLIERIDRNGDGKVAKDELGQRPQLQAFFAIMDKNADEVVTRDEVIATIKQRRDGGSAGASPGDALKNLSNQLRGAFGGRRRGTAENKGTATEEKKSDSASPKSDAGK